jgi:excisionase family DNA binding protein
MVITKELSAGMSILEAAHQAHVSSATLYSLANQGKLPGARRIGKRIIIHRETFLRWLADGMGE